jgi:hypothetical protein
MRATLPAAGVGILAASLLAASPARAHHSIAAEFDMNKTLMVVGTITKMDFRNPHSWLYIDVEDDKGQVQPWAIEFGAVNALYRRGWQRDDLPVGATVAVSGFAALDGSRTLGATEVTLADGRRLFAGTAPPESDQPGGAAR